MKYRIAFPQSIRFAAFNVVSFNRVSLTSWSSVRKNKDDLPALKRILSIFNFLFDLHYTFFQFIHVALLSFLIFFLVEITDFLDVNGTEPCQCKAIDPFKSFRVCAITVPYTHVFPNGAVDFIFKFSLDGETG